MCLTLLLYTNDSVFQARGCDPKLCHLEFKWGHLKSLVIDKKLPIQIIFYFSKHDPKLILEKKMSLDICAVKMG